MEKLAMIKFLLLEQIRTELRAQLVRLSMAALDAHAAATDAGSKAESKYDTRNLESSYLATGQARQVDELAESVRIFDALELSDFAPDALIDVGALVGASVAGSSLYFLMVPKSGGLEIHFENKEITLLSPESNLYQKLLGRKKGDRIDSPSMQVVMVC